MKTLTSSSRQRSLVKCQNFVEEEVVLDWFSVGILRYAKCEDPRVSPNSVRRQKVYGTVETWSKGTHTSDFRNCGPVCSDGALTDTG